MNECIYYILSKIHFQAEQFRVLLLQLKKMLISKHMTLIVCQNLLLWEIYFIMFLASALLNPLKTKLKLC